MPRLATQMITEDQKTMLVFMSEHSGNSIASIVRDILQKEHVRRCNESFKFLGVDEAESNEVV